MAKEEKPLEYQRRIRDTKGVAQRLDLGYLNRPAVVLLLRKKITWIALGIAALMCVPLVLGLGGAKRVLSTGPLSKSHAVFEGRCEVCHAQAFAKVPDAACEKCHQGAAHPADLSKEMVAAVQYKTKLRCAECHSEHRGQAQLSVVPVGECTRCHSNLNDHATGIHIKGVEVSSFRESKHPEFATKALRDDRPFQLNHLKHMKADRQKFPLIPNLPMKCVDCHKTDPKSLTGDLLPMTFEASCKDCHKKELQFDRYQVLGAMAMEAPHTRDQATIRAFVEKNYRDALAANPALVRSPLGRDEVSPDQWFSKVTTDSYEFLFGQRCGYCHQMESQYEVRKIDPRPPVSATAPVQAPLGIKGRFPDGRDWFERSEFSHRSHREVECESCHTKSATSEKTSDVLIPEMKSCLPCHGESRAGLDRCSECHRYHNRSLEQEHDNRRPTEKIIGQVSRPHSASPERGAIAPLAILQGLIGAGVRHESVTQGGLQ